MRRAPWDIMKDMTDRELIPRAEALGVSASYLNWRRERVEVPAATLRAIIDALGDQHGHSNPPPAAQPGVQPDTQPDPHPGTQPSRRPRMPRVRRWGFNVQLYSV